MKNDILAAIKYLDIDINDMINDAYDLYEALNHNGTMDEIIDGMIDIYYIDLRKWSVENHDYIDQAIEKGLCTDLDFHKQIQSGQYVYYSEEARETVEEIYEELTEAVEV